MQLELKLNISLSTCSMIWSLKTICIKVQDETLRSGQICLHTMKPKIKHCAFLGKLTSRNTSSQLTSTILVLTFLSYIFLIVFKLPEHKLVQICPKCT